MKEETIPLGMFEANCVLLYDEDSRHAVVVDPGGDAHALLVALKRLNLNPVACLLTHGHMDHVSALAELIEAYPCPVYLHPSDAVWAFTQANQMLPYYETPRQPAAHLLPVSDNQRIPSEFGEIQVIHTPGHSPGSVCYFLEEHGLLLSGDTLFKGSVGRTDLPGGNPSELARSIKRLKTMPNSTRIIPGHGPDTTMEREKSANYFLQDGLI
ncbi:MAG: MBL fold metallo-hydrolase [Kiritimatiellae bacterium]|nr:MBL fold metallo-hydrolase [Kiritimatiellia bacterium]